MKFIKDHFEKILIIFLVLFFVQQCNTSNKISKLEKQVKLVNHRVDSVYTSDLQKMIQIEGLKTSKRTLYDWNAVIRTVMRPDDRMQQYDTEIEKIRTGK